MVGDIDIQIDIYASKHCIDYFMPTKILRLFTTQLHSPAHIPMHMYLVSYYTLAHTHTHLHALGILLITRSEDIKIRLFKSFSGNQTECVHLTNELLTHTQAPTVPKIARVTQCINHNEENTHRTHTVYTHTHTLRKQTCVHTQVL